MTQCSIKADVSTICRHGSKHGRIFACCGNEGQTFRSAQQHNNDTSADGAVQKAGHRYKIHAEWILKTKDNLNRILSEKTGQPLKDPA